MSTPDVPVARPEAGAAVRHIPLNRAVREALEYEMEHDPTVFMMGEDIGAFGGVYQTATGFLEKFGPERVRDTPISESAFLAAGLGAAMSGLKPIVEVMFVDFVGVCLDPLYNAAAKASYHTAGRQPAPMVIVMGVGGGYSDGSQHSQTLYSTLAHLPGLKVVVPSNAYDAKGLMHSAIADPNPVVYMMHKRLLGMGWFEPIPEATVHVPRGRYTVPIGKARVCREGTDVTVVGVGETVFHALEAAAGFEAQGVSVEVVDLRSVAPLDRETLCHSARKTGRLVVVDEDYRTCGVAGEVIATVVESEFRALRAPPQRVTFPDIPIPYARPLERFVRPDVQKVVDAVRATLA
jgi:pyruvate/2-oxoglutarate/acetoin dehydrogenase E1 component